MDYQVSARKYRPGTFEDVVGQGHVVQTLVNAVTTGRIAHAFLFSGTRGVGKTTVARILAKALNCERGPSGMPCNGCPNCTDITHGTSVDVLEIDGASNTSVDDIREVRENVKFAPFRGRYRVYIIDEVHMLSNSAFNALLKTLEEPPAHVIFIFATTEMHKIPATILSRCQHYSFRRITRSEIIERLRHVAEQEGIEVEDRSLAALARACEGSLRDALSLLDQAVAFGGRGVRHADLEILLGSVPQEQVHAMIAAVVAQDSPAAVRVIADLLDQGHDLRTYCSDVVEYVRHLLVAAVVASPGDLRGLMEVSDDELDWIRTASKHFTPEQLQELFRMFSQAEDGLRVSAHPRFVLEVAAVRATRLLGAGAGAAARPAESGQDSAMAARSEASREGLSSARGGAAEGAVPSPAHRSTPAGSTVVPPQGAARGVPKEPKVGPAAPQVGASSTTRDLSTGDDGSPPAPVAVQATAAVSERRPMNEPADRTTAVDLDWELIQERMAIAHPNIGSFLERGTLVNVKDHQVTIGYSKADTVARALIEQEDNLHTLTNLCAEVTGRPIRVRVIELADGQPVGPSRAEVRAAKAQSQKLALLERTRSHPLVKQALDIFGGEVVEVRQASWQKEGHE